MRWLFDSNEGKCAITGRPLHIQNPASIHIDRDCGGGGSSLYTRGNVQLTEGIFNISKGDNDLESFLLEMTTSIVNHVKNDKKYKNSILKILKEIKDEIK